MTWEPKNKTDDDDDAMVSDSDDKDKDDLEDKRDDTGESKSQQHEAYVPAWVPPRPMLSTPSTKTNVLADIASHLDRPSLVILISWVFS